VFVTRLIKVAARSLPTRKPASSFAAPVCRPFSLQEPRSACCHPWRRLQSGGTASGSSKRTSGGGGSGSGGSPDRGWQRQQQQGSTQEPCPKIARSSQLRSTRRWVQPDRRALAARASVANPVRVPGRAAALPRLPLVPAFDASPASPSLPPPPRGRYGQTCRR
jgi:hypothetical protein